MNPLIWRKLFHKNVNEYEMVTKPLAFHNLIKFDAIVMFDLALCLQGNHLPTCHPECPLYCPTHTSWPLDYCTPTLWVPASTKLVFVFLSFLSLICLLFLFSPKCTATTTYRCCKQEYRWWVLNSRNTNRVHKSFFINSCPLWFYQKYFSLQDYYSIPFATPTTALTGRDGGLTNNPYSGEPCNNCVY